MNHRVDCESKKFRRVKWGQQIASVVVRINKDKIKIVKVKKRTVGRQVCRQPASLIK